MSPGPRVDTAAWRDLTAFQRDVLVAAIDLEESHPSGTCIKSALEETYGEQIVLSRLYQALDGLVDAGLLDKDPGTVDARTNQYVPTPSARELVARQAREYADAVGYRLDCQSSGPPLGPGQG